MKTNFSKFGSTALVLSIGMCAYSCTTENSETIPKSIQTSNYIPSPIALPTNSLDWDESYHPDENPTTRAVNHSDQMLVTAPHVYLAGVYTAKSIEDLYPVEPIDIAYTFPGYYIDHIERPSPISMMSSLKRAIASPEFSGKQSLGFEYDLKQFYKYSELKLAFGANVDVAGIFELEASANYENIKSKSGLFARVVQKNFSVFMDFPYDWSSPGPTAGAPPTAYSPYRRPSA